VPVILGSGGVERVVQLELTVEGKGRVSKSVDAVKELVKVMAGLTG